MRELQLSTLRDPNLFQQFCEQLLSLEYPDFRSINSTCGDEGCDGLANNDEIWFQCYYPEPASHPVLMKRIKRKIARDLAKLKKPYPKEWIFITVDDASRGIHQYCRKKEAKYDGMRILIWSESKIQSLLTKHQSLKDKWLKQIYGEEIKVLQPEGMTYSERNNFPFLLDLDKKMGASLSDWEHGDILKQVHTFDSTGKAQIALEPKDPTVPLEMKLNVKIRFDNSLEGDKKYKEFLDSQKYGKEIEFDHRFIEKASLDINNRKISDFTSQIGSVTSIKLSPVPNPPIDAYIDFYTVRKTRLQRLPKLKMEITKIDESTVQINNYKQETEGVKINLLINTVTGENHFSIKIEDPSADAVDGHRYAKILDNAVRARKINIFLGISAKPIELIRHNAELNEISIICEYSRMLEEIQDRVGEKIPSFFSKPMDNEGIGLIYYVYKIIKTGKVERGRGTFSSTLNSVHGEALSKLLNEDGISLKFTTDNNEIYLLGEKIDLGKKITYFDGVIDDECRKELAIASQNGIVDAITVVANSREIDQAIVEIFPDWIKNADKNIKGYEEKRAQATKNKLFHKKIN